MSTNESPSRRLDRDDAPFIVALVALMAAYVVLFFDFSRPPFEDAAMLMRYAKHLADGHGVVWNVGGPHVDGATDFLFMVVVAGLVRLGATPETAVRALGFLAHALTVVLVYAGIVRYTGARRWTAFLTGAFLALGPGLRYVEAYFGTPVFAAGVAATWFLALDLITGEPPRRTSLLFALAALATGMTRPEGVLLSVFMLCSVVYARGWRRSGGVIVSFFAVFALLGGLYLSWRRAYFGYFLPNPFYAKGGGALHPDSLRSSVENVRTLLLPFLPLFFAAIVASVVSFLRRLDRVKIEGALRTIGFVSLALLVLAMFRHSDPAAHEALVFGWYSPKYALILGGLLVAGCTAIGMTPLVDRVFSGVLVRERGPATAMDRYLAHVRRWTAIVLIPLAGYTVIWVLISNVMNYLMRFQYAVLPVACMTWPSLVNGAAGAAPRLGRFTRSMRRAAVAAGGVVVVGAILLQRFMMPVEDIFHDGRYDMALMLREYAAEKYTMATTEAGLLPFYSNWNAVDIWGFNDRWIAHHVQVTEEYLERYRPELIVMATEYPLDAPPGPPGSWYSVLLTVKHYAQSHNYTLAAAYGGDRRKVHYYYVKHGFEYEGEIIRRIRDIDYTWYLSGRPAVDFAAVARKGN